MTLTVSPAVPADAETIHGFVLALAAYEELSGDVTATAADLAAALFGPAPRVFCDLATVAGKPVGMALWYYSFSTFTGRHGIYLEDLFVVPEARGLGAGKALLAALARRCCDEGLPRLEWEVLDWNTPAIDFYERQGAVLMRSWEPVRLSGAALERLAEVAP